jgi:prepilin peptidase CpaA
MWSSACAGVLLTAIWWDVKTHRIPNPLVLLGMALGLLTSTLEGGVGWTSSIYGCVVGLAVFLPLYLLRILGAGDVKLLGAAGSFVGYPDVLAVALLTGLAGGVLALLMALHHRQLGRMWQQMHEGLIGFVLQVTSGGRPRQWVMVVGPHRLPYAIAIALGTLVHEYLKN